MKIKHFGYISLILLILTALWLVLLIVSMAGKGSSDTLDQAIASLARPDPLGYASYLNAAVLTIVATILLAGLYLYCKGADAGLALIGLIFAPAYCVLNLFAYLSQVTLVPALVSLYDTAGYRDIAYVLLGQSIQNWWGSMVMVLNNLAYAILGISSIAFGLILLKKGKYAKISGSLLILNAIACILGFIGILAGNRLVGMGSLIGGVVFILALVALTLMFFKEAEVTI